MTIMKYKANRPVLRSLLDDFWGTSIFDDTHINEKKWVPAVNVKETDHSFTMELMAPGFEKDDFHISSENGLLTIEGEKVSEEIENEENYTRREFISNSFSRSFTLPDNIVLEDIDAKYDKGMLILNLKKTLIPESKKLEIKVK